MTELHPDLRYATRSLYRAPLFTISVVLSLGLGIGLSSAVFSYLEALFLHPLPGAREIDRVLVLYTGIQGNFLPVSYPNFEDIQRSDHSFSKLAASQVTQVSLSADGNAEQIRAELITPGYFEILGVRSRRGTLESVHDAGAPGLVLSENLWHQRFGGADDIMGRTVSVNRRPFRIVGVAGGGYRGMNRLVPADLWFSMQAYRDLSSHPELMSRRADQTVQVIGRLRPEVRPEQAESAVAGIWAQLAQAYPADLREQTILALPLSQASISPNSRANLLRNGVLLGAIAAVLLLITFSNVGSLLLSRAVRRSPEIALRAALGAGRWRTARQLLTEGFVFAALALPIALAFAWIGALVLWKFRPPVLAAVAMENPLDFGVLGFALLLSAVGLLLFCLAPLLYIFRLNAGEALKGTRAIDPARARSFSSQRCLVVAEVALGFIAISCASFFLLRLRDLQSIDPGFNSERLVAVSFDLRSLGLDAESSQPVRELLRERISGLPEVEAAAFAENRLMNGFQMLRSIKLKGQEDEPILVGSGLVEPGYFETVGVPILQGRGFTTADRPGTASVALVNRTMADRLWPGKSPVGEHVWVDEEESPVEIVGVAADTKLNRLDEPPRPLLYLAFAQRECLRMSLQLRSKAETAAVIAAIHREARKVAPDLPVEVEDMAEVVDGSLSWARAVASLLALLSLIAMIVAGVGIYGMAAYSINRKQREIGLRIALGARRSRILALVLRESTITALLGTLIGGLAAFAATRWSAGLLRVPPPTWTGFIVCFVVLLALSCLAVLAPAVRTLRIEPSAALKGS